jgi:Ca-activated chloride channel family protein
MDIRERLGLVQSSLALLVRSLRSDDTISIVTYGDEAWPLLDPTPVAEWPRIVAAIDALRPSGSTNMEAGLQLGYEAARRSYDPDALNVVVLASDGVANQGVTDAEVLTDQITTAGDEGIHLVTVGYGMGNYNDHLMEQLADLGDGFYSYVDTFAEAVDLFVDNLAPTLTVVAEEAKIQVVFDDESVARYRLIGYENRGLDDDQFSDDTVDAGELGAGHHATAVYEIELVDAAPAGEVAAGEVRLRWRSTASGETVEVRQPLTIGDGSPSASLRLAALVAHTAEVLRGNAVTAERGVTLDSLLAEADELAAMGVEGASEIAGLISTAMHAEDPVALGPTSG